MSTSTQRRRFLKTAAAASIALPAMQANAITEENARQGTVEWQLQHTRFDNEATMAAYPLNRQVRSSVIEGYASKTSVAAGETIDFKVSMKPAAGFVVDIYRMGYYGGAGGRHYLRMGPFRAEPQDVPMMTVERLRECRWPTVASLTIPKGWPSGVYLAKLTRDEWFGPQSYIVFVVKEHRQSDLLCMAADITWQAYNKWPARDSLYDDGTAAVWYTGPNVRVSFDRPYAKYCQVIDSPQSVGSGSFLLWELPLAFWLEQQGYDVTYCSNLDLELDPGILKTSKALLSVGHDEYWSREMFNNVLQAREDGLNLAFLSGNALSGEIIFYESSVNNAPARAFARRRNFPDEETLMGSTSYGSGYGDWIVTKPEHWIYSGTGVKQGDKIPGLIGWEYHGAPLANLPGLEVVAKGPIYPPQPPRPGAVREHSAVVFQRPRGNWVFNAGTIWWPEGLSQPPGHIPGRTYAGGFGVNPHVQRITKNVLDRMIKDAPRRG
ncbi:MAG: hypothetical protein IT168_02125 [Bryobacterales bacterium]|nr:hypothetical protein [Bryobacterales bacterium]